MPWQRVEEIDEYRLNTKNLDEWLKSKWGDYDYEIEVSFCRHGILVVSQHPDDMLTLSFEKYSNGLYSFWSLEPKEVGRVAALITRRLMIHLTGPDG